MLEQPPIPVVIVTAFSERDVVERAIEAGVFGYLVKPFRESDLLPAIETARARARRARRRCGPSPADLREALAARKVIERAKGLLMERDGLTEAEAFARMRRPPSRPAAACGRSPRPMVRCAFGVLGQTRRRLGRLDEAA